MKLSKFHIVIIALSFSILAGFIITDLLKFRKITKSIINNQEVINTDRPVPPEYQIPPAPEFDPNKPEIVCRYLPVVEEEIQESNDSSKIQKNIGYENNKVGIYIYAEVEDFADLANELVNSNGGDWGYVLVPYNVKDYDDGKWNTLFENLSKNHLIPIIQLWDLDLDEDKRDKEIISSAKFLNILEWPIKNRYISAYNEVNDKRFWKGNINPKEYAEVLDKTISTFKDLNENFFIMNGAFNASARTGPGYLDEETFLIRMNDAVPGIFKRLDGWASHHYPQPNFSASPNGYGRDSIRAYEWELDILRRRFNVTNLPVFITETGWAHKETDGNDSSSQYKLDKYKVADNIKYAFEKVWLPDDRIVAITPFTIKYDPPYDHFSWVTANNNPYPQFEAVKSIEKIKGKPQIVKYYKSKEVVCE